MSCQCRSVCGECFAVEMMDGLVLLIAHWGRPNDESCRARLEIAESISTNVAVRALGISAHRSARH